MEDTGIDASDVLAEEVCDGDPVEPEAEEVLDCHTWTEPVDIPSTGSADNGRPVHENAIPASDGEWTTFANSSLEEPPQSSPLSQRQLEEGSEPAVIGCLLDEDDIIQEFESGSPQLLDLLCTPESMRVLLHLITRGCVSEEDSSSDSLTLENSRPIDQVLRRRPLIAQGLMTCQSSSCDRLLAVFDRPEGAELFDLLWSFFEQPASQMAPVLAGYTCSTAATLLGKRPTLVTKHLRHRDTSRLLDQFLCLMESKSCVELLACLMYAEDESKLVFPVEGLAAKLVACFDLQGECDGSILEHALWLINVLVARSCMGVLCVGQQILQQFSSPHLVMRLIDQVVCNSQPPSDVNAAATATPAGSAGAASALNILVYHTHLLMQDPLLPVRSPDLRPPSCCLSAPAHHQQQAPSPPPPPAPPPPLPLGSSSGESGGEGGENTGNGQEPPCEDEPQAEPEANADDSSAQDGGEEAKPSGVGNDGSDYMDEADARLICAEALVHHTSTQLPRLCAVLDTALNRQPGAPAGATVIEVVCLFSQLLKTARHAVFQAARDVDLLPKCLQVMFHFPWSTLLHNALRSVIYEFLNNREQGLPSVLALIHRSDIMERVVEQVGSEAEARNAGHRHRSQPRVGYLGHLRILCEDLAELGKSEAEVGDQLFQVKGWADVIMPELEFMQRLPNSTGTPQSNSAEGSPAGKADASGGSEFDCISAVRTAMANLTEELDLSLEDLRDLDEEMTASTALEMASAHHARRRERGDASTKQQEEENQRRVVESEELKLLGAVMEAVKIELEVEGQSADEDAEKEVLGDALLKNDDTSSFDEGNELPKPDGGPADSMDKSSTSQPPLEMGSINCTVGSSASADGGGDQISVDTGSNDDISDTPTIVSETQPGENP